MWEGSVFCLLYRDSINARRLNDFWHEDERGAAARAEERLASLRRRLVSRRVTWLSPRGEFIFLLRVPRDTVRRSRGVRREQSYRG